MNLIPTNQDQDQEPQGTGLITGLTRELSHKISTNLLALEADKAAYSPATMSMVNHCWERWLDYCKESSINPLPVDIDLLRGYLRRLSRTLCVSSITSHLHAINFIQRNADLPSLTQNERITRLLKILRKEAVEKRETIDQALPMRLGDLRLLVALYDDKAVLQKQRDIALLVVAYHTLLREAEVSRLKVADIQDGEKGTGAVFVGRTKTSLSAEGEYRALSRWGLRIVRDWIAAANLEPDDYLFCKVSKDNKPIKATKPITGVAIDGIFRRAYLALGNEPLDTPRYATWTGHSARVGAALDMAANGIPVHQIMQAGGWKSPSMVMRYIRKLELADSAMIRLTEGQE